MDTRSIEGVGVIRPARRETIEKFWAARWGIPIVTPTWIYRPADVEGLSLRDDQERVLGLITWKLNASQAEIVSFDTMEHSRGWGSHLLQAAEEQLAACEAEWVRVFTTNDNLPGLRFYLHRGYRLVKVHLNAMDHVREIKPRVPSHGREGVVLQDLWEVQKSLA